MYEHEQLKENNTIHPFLVKSIFECRSLKPHND